MSTSIRVQDFSFSQLAGLDATTITANYANKDGQLCIDAKLALDTYQRPYVWQKSEVLQLFDDLLKYVKSGKSHVYYMGTILLHRKDGHFYVIDGQQRLSSLAVLYHAINNNLPGNIEFSYRERQSVKSLQTASQSFIEAWRSVKEEEKERFKSVIFDRVSFTVIAVDNEDLAFTFFDTQNSRGVPLSATDLLKAFHLRAIDDADKKTALQIECDLIWQQLQAMASKGNDKKDNDFATVLFPKYLWRARHWLGRENALLQSGDETRRALMESFQKKSITSEDGASCTLYPGFANVRHASLEWQGKDIIHWQPTAPVASLAMDLPFSIRQPVHQGLGFFLYAQKYARLLKLLLGGTGDTPEQQAFGHFYATVQNHQARYLRELFLLATLMYVDRLGWSNIVDFSRWLDHYLGAVRLNQSPIKKETPIKLLRDAERNLLDVIASAYRHDEVVGFLQARKECSQDFWRAIKNKPDIAEILSGHGVRAAYLKALREYYKNRIDIDPLIRLNLSALEK